MQRYHRILKRSRLQVATSCNDQDAMRALGQSKHLLDVGHSVQTGSPLLSSPFPFIPFRNASPGQFLDTLLQPLARKGEIDRQPVRFQEGKRLGFSQDRLHDTKCSGTSAELEKHLRLHCC